jgi:autotransporter-associated beta strand protein/T5SS/PEP-CTERM-associated repeat protein
MVHSNSVYLKNFLLATTALVAVSVLASPVAAQTTWTNSTTDNNWFTAGNWDNAVPTNATNGFITDPATNTQGVNIVGAAAFANQLQIDAGNDLRVNGPAASLTITDLLTVGPAGGAEINSMEVLAGATATADRVIISSGIVSVSGADSTLNASTSLVAGDTGNGTLFIGEDATVNISGGAGVLTLGANGGRGLLQLGSNSAFGTLNAASVDMSNGGVSFWNVGTGTFAVPITGAGIVTKEGAGTVILTAANSYSGLTIMYNGTMTLGSAAATVGTSEIRFSGNSSLTTNFNNTIANDFNVEQDVTANFGAANGTTLTLGPNAQTYGINSVMRFGGNGNNGVVELNSAAASFHTTFTIAVDSGTLRVGNSSAGSLLGYAGANLGAGGLIVDGTLDLNGIETFASQLSGSGLITSSVAGALTFRSGNVPGDPTADSTFAGTIEDGAGVVSFVKGLTNTLTLTGISTYTGATTVDSGTLRVDGSIASSALTTVNANATLTGAGAVGATQISAGGIFAPGNGTAGSSMNVASLALASGAQYMVQINPTTSSFANVTGTATLGGSTLDATFANGSYVERQYTVLTAGNVSGAFGTSINTNLPSNFQTALSYDGTHAYLDLSLVFVPPPGSGLSVNQQNVGNAIVNFFNSNGSIPIVFGALTPAGLTQISGETATGSQQTTFDAMNLFMGVMTDPFIAGRGDPVSAGGNPNAFAAAESLAYAANGKPRSKSEREAYAAIYRKAPPIAPSFEQRWSLWAAGFGGSQRTDGSTIVGSNDTRSSVYGVAAGADYRLSPSTLAGFALAGGGTSFAVVNGGSGRSDLFQAGAFIRHNVGPAYLSAALAYGWQDITTDRTVTVAGFDRLRAQFNANAWSGRVEGGYRFVTQGIGITPYAAGQFTTFELPNYAEAVVSGADTFALTYAARSVTTSRSELGLRSDKSFAMQDGIFTLRGRAAWAHNFNTDRNITSTFQTLPGASFVVNGAAQARDAALVTGSAEMKWLNGFSVAGTFEGEFSGVTESYAGKGVVRYAW